MINKKVPLWVCGIVVLACIIVVVCVLTNSWTVKDQKNQVGNDTVSNLADSSGESSQETVTESEQVTSDNRESGETELVSAKLTGGITVTVRELIPDYVFDDQTLNSAVVTCFQTEPFIINHIEKFQLQVGKTYTLTIADKLIGGLEETEIGKELDYNRARALYGPIEFTEAREANENELGLDGVWITVEREE